MSWRDYYDLLEKYDGDIRCATDEEMQFAARCNPNDPITALYLAKEQWKQKENEGSV